MTAKMEMRIRQTIRTGQKILITGEVKKKTRKVVETYARAAFEDGTLAAEASASMYVTDQDF
jgi:acyl-coenzyme A thioesterase PaaI-like protein